MNADAILRNKSPILLNNEPFFLWEIGHSRVIEHWMDHLFRSNASLTLWLEEHDAKLAAFVAETFPLCKRAAIKTGLPDAATDACTFADSEGVIQLQRGTALVSCLPDQPATRTWFAIVKKWLLELHKFGTQLPELETQIAPGVVIGHHCSISKDTVFHAPCWIGNGCTISGAAIGPNVVIGEECVIATGVHVTDSYVLRRSFIRPNTRLDGVVVTPEIILDHATGEAAALS
ncbi:hypothetical protein [Prosthecobacter sp.]|uniref:hypothetical protein n=1 Tax=Prosthecobacter sp. TaxID=1965333 RepID=UPI001DCDD788|nr:hypothetical protein [Prosthecobacter sp.]MCB1277602.1 hypothetical protein [Prosthecobacter sp.]